MDVKQTFYIVLGSFSDKSNAERSVAKLVSEGKNSATTVERNGKYLVTISNYSNIDDANAGVKTIKETYSKAWILKP
jgi:cell division protein FtsN